MKGRANVALVHHEQIVPLWVFHQCKLDRVRDCTDIVATHGYLLVWSAHPGSCDEHDTNRGDKEAHGGLCVFFYHRHKKSVQAAAARRTKKARSEQTLLENNVHLPMVLLPVWTGP